MRDLPDCGAIYFEELAYEALGIFNLAFYLVRGQVDKTRRNMGQESFKFQPLFQCLFSLLTLGDVFYDGDEVQGFARGVPHEGDSQVDPNQGAVLAVVSFHH